MICQRCAKAINVKNICHTCTPSDLVRKLEEVAKVRTQQCAEVTARMRELEQERGMKAVREMHNMLGAMQNGELTVSRGVELLDLWLAGNYTDDMLPPVREGLGEDEMPWDRIDALTKQRDELLVAIDAHGHHKWCKRRVIVEMQRRGLFKDQPPPECDCSFKDIFAKAKP